MCAALVMMLWPSAAWSTGDTVVQQIGELSGEVAEAVISEVGVVPFSPRIDARTTPILLASGKAFVLRGRPHRVGGLGRAEKRALRRAYEAGQTIMLLGASAHDVEALHVLLRDGAQIEATGGDLISLAYALRQENNLPMARTVSFILSSLRDDDPAAHDRAFEAAIDVVVGELLHPPAVVSQPLPPTMVAGEVDWAGSPVQQTTFTSTSHGIYNTPVGVYALHACKADIRTGIFYDYYLVNTGGDWTATESKYQAASTLDEIFSDGPNRVTADWKDFAWNERPSNKCDGGFDAWRENAVRICRYVHYPLSYEIELVPSDGPAVTQIRAIPRGNQGRSETYSSGFRWTLGVGANVSGQGPSGGVQAGVSWNNSVTTTVPPLAILAGDTKQQGAFTTYKYCTAGSTAECESSVQMLSAGGLCRRGNVGHPQQGQTPDGRLTGVAQTALWQVNPDSYVGDTFDVEVSWKGNLATTTSRIWNGHLQGDFGPDGYCNVFYCNCGIHTAPTSLVQVYTFKIPIPSKVCKSPEG